ncbi:hypothetical protein SAMN05216360_1441 [Methylobacterium phyllostachyos]|uniref:Uncharacterized protein n=1 Tax=Methylobacterium phyllostachyos TaxID=582672 RepID=A0A1H0LQZ7_9HYPH|nr:hypothetical protein SAMN05216360_1441 [Methylobacterium phyllostachyos]
MDSSRKDKLGPEGSERRRSLGQHLFARFGTPAILITVLLVVVAWAGFLGWGLIRLLSWLVR